MFKTDTLKDLYTIFKHILNLCKPKTNIKVQKGFNLDSFHCNYHVNIEVMKVFLGSFLFQYTDRLFVKKIMFQIFLPVINFMRQNYKVVEFL